LFKNQSGRAFFRDFACEEANTRDIAVLSPHAEKTPVSLNNFAVFSLRGVEKNRI
jgi:hypothetical protein